MSFGTWNVMSLYKSGSLTTVHRELARYKLDLVCIQEDRWDKGGTVEQGIVFLYMEKEMKINWEQTFWDTTDSGVWGVQTPPKFRRPSKIVPNSTQLWKLLKIAEFRMPTPQDVRKKGSKILKLPRFAIVLY